MLVGQGAHAALPTTGNGRGHGGTPAHPLGATSGLLLDVIAEAQREVGERWAAGTWSVSERVVAAVSRQRPAGEPTGVGRIAVACLDGEWHGLPARLLAEVLTRHGWEVTYLGSIVPATQVAMHVNAEGPTSWRCRGSLPSRLPAARRLVEACRATGTPVLAGGPTFGPDGERARAVGAGGWAPDARAAVALLETPSLAGDDAAITVDDTSREEQAVLQGRRGELASGIARRLRDAGDVSAELTDDLGHLIDFLAAAVYVDDAGLLARFVRWTGSVSVPGGLTGDEVGRAVDELATPSARPAPGSGRGPRRARREHHRPGASRPGAARRRDRRRGGRPLARVI